MSSGSKGVPVNLHFYKLYVHVFNIRKKLKEAKMDATTMTHQINDSLKKIAENEKQARDLGKSVFITA